MTEPASQILPLASLRPGMHLAEAVHDRLGNIMLTEGTLLTEDHLAALAKRGIASAMILPERIPPTAAEIAEMRQSIEDRLRQIFRGTLDFPGNRRMFEMLLAYRLERLE
jgi:hypothetical protein